MRVVDTSAWIEWLVGSATGDRLRAHLPERDAWLAPTIVQLELAKWVARNLDPATGDQIIAFSQLCVVAALDTEIALAAAELCRAHRLATADAIVYATALAHQADLLTCDAHFDGLEHVIYVPKAVAGA